MHVGVSQPRLPMHKAASPKDVTSKLWLYGDRATATASFGKISRTRNQNKYLSSNPLANPGETCAVVESVVLLLGGNCGIIMYFGTLKLAEDVV